MTEGTTLSIVEGAFSTAQELVSSASSGMLLIAAALCGVGIVMSLMRR